VTGRAHAGGPIVAAGVPGAAGRPVMQRNGAVEPSGCTPTVPASLTVA
jgi:hypothetical protein